MTEKQIERRLVDGVRKNNGMCLKFTCPGLPGVPDRIVLTSDGRVYFVELKTEIGRLSNIQKWVIEEMRWRGHDVKVLWGPDAVKEFLKEVFV